jgi:hypothetical protein
VDLEGLKKQLFLEDVAVGDRPIVLMTRVGLMGLFIFLLLMVRIVWRRRPKLPTRRLSND